MTKPDDIPQDVWDCAIKCAETVCRNLPDDYGDITIEVTAIARAILAEREQIGEWAEAIADHHDAEAVAADDEASVVENRGAERALRDFAAAILKGTA